jgi:protein involved in sex pheromone biosynthesis
MYRKITLVFLTAVLFLSGCLPGFEDDGTEVVKKDEEGKEKQINITPEVETTNEYYRSVVEFEPGAARGLILHGVDNRIDIDELETGLMRLSQDTFAVDQYVFQQGQFLTNDIINSWVRNKSTANPAGLGPELPENYEDLSWQKKVEFRKSNPSYLSYVVEQNYLVKNNEDEYTLGGISIGISLNKVYNYEVEDKDGKLHRGDVPLQDQEKVFQTGKQYAKIILQRIREDKDIPNVPLVVTLYQEQALQSMIPGNFFAKTVIEQGEASIDEWETVNERYYLFPSEEASEKHRTDAEKFDNFKDEIQTYFPNFIGVIGSGFYKDDELRHLKIEIPIKFYAQSEVIAFTHFVAGKVMENHFPFSKDVSLQVYVSSVENPEAIIVREPDMDEPIVHIYR